MIGEIQNKVLKFLKKYNLLNEENILLVAFSGGADSLCLLDILNNLSNENNFKVIAAHLNHNWRGLESKQEESIAREYCTSRNIPFYSETLPEGLPHTELEARKQRYLFLNKAAKEFNACAILTGHTLNDQVETVLYRIIKGTGINGLRGIPEIRYQEDAPTIYRPILKLSREETEKYCSEKGLKPSFDTSNLSEKYLRNRVRLNLIPELKSYNSDVESALLRLSHIANDTENLIDEYLDDIKNNISTENNEIKTKKFLKLSVAAQKRIILDYLASFDIQYDFEKIDEIIRFIDENSDLKSGNTLSLTNNCWLFCSSKIIRLIHSIRANMIKSSIIANLDGETYHEELDKTLRILPWKDDKPQRYPSETSNIVYADLSWLKEPLYLRTRQPGDKFQPFGLKDRTKLKKYLINKGIPEFKRDSLPVLAMDSEILWVVGVGISEKIRVKDIPTHIIEIV